MSNAASLLQRLAREFATVIPDVDAVAEHDRWQPGLGPFEEDIQLDKILDALGDEKWQPVGIDREVPYPESDQRCDLLLSDEGYRLPVEVKLLRFRLDNGNIDPNMYKSVFSPFPERTASSLLTDVHKLAESELGPPAGLLGLYYEKKDEPYDLLEADRIAEKLRQDVDFWYGLDIETVAVSPFEDLRHPHHQRGAVITWMLPV